MDLFVMRHGQAHPQVTDDASRQLTPHGLHETQMIAHHLLSDKKWAPNKIISSTYTRAIQTAEAVAQVIHYKLSIPQSDLILPDSDPRQALTFLMQQSTASLLIVSHQPLVGQLISLLVDGVIEERHVPTSAVAYIQFDDAMMVGAGHLKWLKAPQ